MACEPPPKRLRWCAPTVMPTKVVDASALAALLFGEPEAEAIASALEGATLIAPALLAYELANVCLIKTKRHPQQQAAFLAAFRLRNRLAMEEVTIDHDGAVDLARHTGLTVYDASYLWLARERRAELVTLDRQLAQVATAILTP